MDDASRGTKRKADEASSGEGPAAQQARRLPVSSTRVTDGEEDFERLLHFYYDNMFPFETMFRWLSYDNDDGDRFPGTYFSRREFSHTILLGGKDEVYTRYQSFQSAEDLKAEIVSRVPVKIDIGAVFNTQPRDHKTAGAFTPLEKEFVLDIDMNDYDDVRRCACRGEKRVCGACWPILNVAIKVLDAALREDFGFEHLLWIFSGRRGIHCWVCDKRARSLSSSARSAISEYLTTVRGGDNVTRKVMLSQPLHPSLERAKQIVEERFVDVVLLGQGVFHDDELWNELIARVTDQPNVHNGINRARAGNPDDAEGVWEAVIALFRDTPRLRLADVWEVMFELTYPRLDIAVSKGVNHLLKSPFCVHPGTGKVCVPIDPENCDAFDPNSVPTLPSLLAEFNDTNGNVRATSITPHLDTLDRFVDSLQAATRVAPGSPLDF